MDGSDSHYRDCSNYEHVGSAKATVAMLIKRQELVWDRKQVRWSRIPMGPLHLTTLPSSSIDVLHLHRV